MKEAKNFTNIIPEKYLLKAAENDCVIVKFVKVLICYR